MRIPSAFVVLIAIGQCACDPGLFLHPVEWKQTADFAWETESNGLRFRVGVLGGLIGEKDGSVELTVQNGTNSFFVMDEAVVETNGRTFHARFPGQGEEKWRSAAPGATERLNVYWSFGEQPMYKVYGETAVIRIAYRHGAAKQTMRIGFTR